MIKNYFLVAVRHAMHNRLSSLINIVGLAVGMACGLLMLMLIQDDLGYDRHFAHADRICRVLAQHQTSGAYRERVPAPWGPGLAGAFDEIDDAVRLVQENRVVVAQGDARFYETQFFYADPSFLSVFSLPLIAGDGKTALVQSDAVVIRDGVAQKYFGDADPLGKTLTVLGASGGKVFTVTGVFASLPEKSHLQMDFIGSLQALHASWNLDNPMNFMYVTYLLLDRGVEARQFESRMGQWIQAQYGILLQQHGLQAGVVLQPLTDIHLYSPVRYGIPSGGDVRYLYAYGAISVFLLLIASINFTNLATAQAVGRAREVGIRKAAGASRSRLVLQFLFEAYLLSGLALLLALALVELFLPVFNAMMARHLSLNWDWQTAMGIVGLGVAFGTFAGSYPAFFMSSFRPALILKGAFVEGAKRGVFRQVLVGAQFAIAVGLLIATLVVYEQMRFLFTRNLGFDRDHVVVIPLTDSKLRKGFDALKTALLQHPQVLGVTGSVSLPGDVPHGWLFRPVDPPGKEQSVSTMLVDPAFIDVMGLHVLRGCDFNQAPEQKIGHAFVINETAARTFGWDVGQVLANHGMRGGPQGMVIGVVKDFHFASLHHPIAPMVMLVSTWPQFLSARIAPTDVAAVLGWMRETWYQFAPHQPFEYAFLDARFDRFYQSDRRLQTVVSAFALLVLLVAGLGLVGLVAFEVARRTKEVGIRKVLGASVWQVVVLLVADVLKPVVLGNFIAWPVAWWVMHRWLQNFAYRIDFGLGTLLLGGTLVVVIALSTVSLQAFKAAHTNPVDALRYE